ncbi:MAG: DUF4136 domain-containing protein [Burkholderiaceae bacterium]
MRLPHAAAALLCAALLAGCAGMTTLQAEITTYGEWPAQRAPGSYAFDRLPSQQARADVQQRLEDAAHRALQGAGFVAAAPGATPDVLVQVGARVTRTDYVAWDDPLWWRGGFGYWRPRPWPGPYWGYAPYTQSRFDREVALLIRDRASGTPLYEARASSDGYSSGGAETLEAMYRAAMADFPRSGVNPRSVSVPLKAASAP